MICQAWAECSAEEGLALIGREIEAWQRELQWDIRDAWRAVEPARRAGHLPGFVVRDQDGRIVAWAGCTMVGRIWHVFAFDAPGGAAAHTLVEAVLQAARRAGAARVVFSVRQVGSALGDALSVHGFRVDRYLYLSKPLEPTERPALALTAWSDHDAAMARLCARAYRDAPGVRAFALEDTPDAWDAYVAGLVKTNGCGEFVAALSAVVLDVGGELAAGVMVTSLGGATRHIAQLAVDPTARRRGLARSLITSVEHAADSAGASHLTLLVSASNSPALGVYRSRGFRARASFVVAADQPSLSTSLALEIGGARTRR